MSYTAKITALAFVASLCGCGGGGGGNASTSGDAQPSFTTVNAAAAWTAVTHSSRTWAVSGTGTDGKAYTLNYSIAAGASGTIAGVAGDAVSFTTLLKQGSTTISNGTATLYLKSGTSVAYGLSRDDGDCALISNGGMPPTSAVLGQTGALYSGNVVLCSSGLTALESLSTTWSVETEGATAYFCVNTKDAQAILTSNTAACIQVDAAGTLGTAARFSLDNGNGFSITMR